MKNISFTQFSVRNSVCKACAAINLEKKYVVNIYLLGGYDGGRSLYVFELGFYMH